MPADPVWGLLAKAQDDPQTILEAIDEKIAAHEADEEAHLGVGESLQSHRASEIIDHYASSVIEDKIKNGEITLSKKSWSEFEFLSFFESLDAWDYSPAGVAVGLAGCALQTSTTINTVKYLSGEGLGDADATDWTKKMLMQVAAKLSSITNQTVYFMLGSVNMDGTDNSFGFKVSNGTLYAIHIVSDGEDQTEYTAEITGVTLTDFNIYRAEWDPTSQIFSFYVNGVLKTSQSTDIPTENNAGLCGFYIKNLEAANKVLYLKYFFYSKEL
jgi:hypothetical protein